MIASSCCVLCGTASFVSHIDLCAHGDEDLRTFLMATLACKHQRSAALRGLLVHRSVSSDKKSYYVMVSPL